MDWTIFWDHFLDYFLDHFRGGGGKHTIINEGGVG